MNDKTQEAKNSSPSEPVAMWEQLIKDSHCGYANDTDYKSLVSENPISENDLKYFESVINSAMNGGQCAYDTFPDEGGIDIAAALLEEVKRLRAFKK